jgi:hypothetical protein
VVNGWSRCVVNPPERIAMLTRDGVCAALRTALGVAMPTTARTDRLGYRRWAKAVRLSVGSCQKMTFR